jgi:hypothetical protein
MFGILVRGVSEVYVTSPLDVRYYSSTFRRFLTTKTGTGCSVHQITREMNECDHKN